MNLSQSTTDLSTATPSPLFSRRSSSSATGDFASIPSNHPSRTLVICFCSGNGSGGKYDTGHSNLETFYKLLERSDQQHVLDCRPAECGMFCSVTPDCLNKLCRFLDKDYADSLDQDLVHVYDQLVSLYKPGDRISLFGFSRGAYTARAFAEMIHKVGLLPRRAQTESLSAYPLYVQDIDDDWHKAYATFNELGPLDVRIDFVGVWDTVPSVGDVIPRTLPFARSNTSIRVFRHALALHEPRARLHPKFYEFDTKEGVDTTDAQEVWFAGSHWDVGGCAVPEDTPHSLGRIPLRWMVRECFRTNTGIQFSAERLRAIGLDPASLYPVVEDRPRPLQPRCYHFNTIAPRVPLASEEEHDVRDALSPMHDQFAPFTPLWWVLELFPLWIRIPLGPPTEWKGQRQTVRMSLPRGLACPTEDNSHFYVHPTVHIRAQANPTILNQCDVCYENRS